MEWSTSVFSKPVATIKDRRAVLIYATGDYLYAGTSADKLGGASYTERFNRPTVLAVGFDFFLVKKLVLGLRYEYWLARRKFDLGGIERTDILQYQTAGAELGLFLTPNPRVYFLFSAGVAYPVQMRVLSNGSNGIFENSQKVLSFQGRVVSGIRFNSVLSFFFEGGYRRSILGNLKSGSTDFLPGGESLDFSSPFLGAGFAFQF